MEQLRAFAGSGLLDREQELARIAAAFEAAAAGRGGLLAVVGSAGIGKSRLLKAAMGLCAASGGGIASARGGQVETEFAFGVVRQLFEPVWAAGGRAERDALLAGPAAPLASLLGGPAVVSEPLSGGDRGFATLHGLYWLTANLAARAPLMIAVDDAHWVDAPSLRFIVYLARRVRALRVLLVVAVRGEDPGARGLLLSELVSDPRAEVLRPGLLTLEAVGSLVRDAFSESTEGSIGSPPVAQLLGRLAPAGEAGLFVTLGYYSPDARKLAEERSNLRLIDGAEFVDLLLNHYDELHEEYRSRFPLRLVWARDLSAEADEPA